MGKTKEPELNPEHDVSTWSEMEQALYKMVRKMHGLDCNEPATTDEEVAEHRGTAKDYINTVVWKIPKLINPEWCIVARSHKDDEYTGTVLVKHSASFAYQSDIRVGDKVWFKGHGPAKTVILARDVFDGAANKEEDQTITIICLNAADIFAVEVE